MKNFTKITSTVLILTISSFFALGQTNTNKLQKTKSAHDILAYDKAVSAKRVTNAPVSNTTKDFSGNDATKDILWDNGPLITFPGGGSGGSDYSELQDTFGMELYGSGNQISVGNSVADDFEVTDTWTINTFTFYGYQTNSGNISTLNDVRFQIYDGDPSAGGNVIFGDLVTNKMLSTEWTNIWRVLETNPLEDRPVMRIVADAFGLVLSPGTYWVEWQVGGTVSSGPWAPPITISGETTTGNALHFTSSGWAPAVDDGTLQNQGFPFIIEGNMGALPDNDIGVSQIISPVSGVELSSSEIVTIKIANIGNNPQSNFEVSFSIDGGAVITETVSATINSLEFYEFTFSVPADLSEYGTYALEACTALEGDENPIHDCATKSIENSEQNLCVEGLYITGCALGDGLISWDLAEINVPEIACDGNPYEWYHDYTDMVHTLGAGTGYTLTAQAGYENTFLDVWIDYNDDFFFDDNEHIVDDFLLADEANSYEIPITLPVDAPSGQHLLRYRTNWEEIVIGSCDTYNYGNMCDFTADIGGGPPINPPLNLTSSIEAGNVLLSWDAPVNTVKNLNKDLIEYRIYQNLEGGAFTVLGTTTETSYTDEGPSIGLHCYYVTAVYDEGESDPTDETCQLISSIEETIKHTISIYPNPATDFVNIQSDFNISDVKVYNYAGQTIRNENVNNNFFQINISELIQGIYFFQINTSEGSVSKRIVIQ